VERRADDHAERISLMDRIVKLAVVVAVLMAGTGVFYYYVVFLPSVERQKSELAEREKQEAAKRESERQRAYEVCNSSAQRNYDANWATACSSFAEGQSAAMKNCLTDRAIMSNEFMGAAYCRRTYGAGDPSPTCSLPTERANSLNATFKYEKERCLAEAKLGLQ
jgi:hypothetical protein